MQTLSAEMTPADWISYFVVGYFGLRIKERQRKYWLRVSQEGGKYTKPTTICSQALESLFISFFVN